MKLGIGIGIDVSKKPLDTTPAIPETLTVTGITNPIDSSPLVFTRIEDENGKPKWQTDDFWVIYWVDVLGGIWIVADAGAANYEATFASTADTPVGLIGWTVTTGAGEPSLVGS